MRNLLFALCLFCTKNAVAEIYSIDTVLMGSSFIFTAVSSNADSAYIALNEGVAEVIRIEKLISSWKPNSQTSAINSNAGVAAVKVDKELFDLIERSIKVSNLSEGYFDISFASINHNWKFDGSAITDIDSVAIASSVNLINYHHIILDRLNLTVMLKEKGMSIGFGAIGKGYAADRAKLVMQNLGIRSGIVNAGGDLISWGKKEDGKVWSIGIIDPEDKNKIVSFLDISDLAVVTSGDYEKFVMIDGVRHGHIINPKTGFPSKGVKSVTIITNTAEIADALATTVFVLGETKGIELVNQLKGVE